MRRVSQLRPERKHGRGAPSTGAGFSLPQAEDDGTHGEWGSSRDKDGFVEGLL